jgi:hypothetical protein
MPSPPLSISFSPINIHADHPLCPPSPEYSLAGSVACLCPASEFLEIGDGGDSDDDGWDSDSMMHPPASVTNSAPSSSFPPPPSLSSSSSHGSTISFQGAFQQFQGPHRRIAKRGVDGNSLEVGSPSSGDKKGPRREGKVTHKDFFED